MRHAPCIVQLRYHRMRLNRRAVRPTKNDLNNQGNNVRESKIEAYLVKQVKELGGEVRKVKWIGRTGAPDRVVMLPYRARYWTSETMWVELKATNKDATSAQDREHVRMRKMGQHVVVINSIEDVDLLLAP